MYDRREDYDPKSWEPGDPLYTHPWGQSDPHGTTVRYLIELSIDEPLAVWEDLLADHWVCTDCEVAWRRSKECWVCGRRGHEPVDF